jgi:hypothetical protein
VINKVIEHVQELIEDGTGTVGGLSEEGNEGDNKIFRHLKEFNSFVMCLGVTGSTLQHKVTIYVGTKM